MDRLLFLSPTLKHQLGNTNTEGDGERVEERKRGHERSSSGTWSQPGRGYYAGALCIAEIHLLRLRFIRGNTCTALNCIMFSLHACLAVPLNAATSGEANRFKVNICSSKQ
ncbi:Hypothetical predicted protein [Xyrichtys novacula]|uniref:Uncharacterized protein n=1 Tax=Xyrichtys novacula TaxID=13765 RepID=A0AAV1GM17_XYRNO|nr:Hypothetical predicted protein [Xyrichtys novacula]